MQTRFQKLHSSLLPVLLALLALLFSFWLMVHTFSYDAKTNSMFIATKAWSDFGSHIPLIRSFSMGDNWHRLLRGEPLQHPLYPGVPIRYHFLFYTLVGLLEKAGLRIDWAFNIPNALGFFFLIVITWKLAKELFTDTRVAALSVLFFLFNGSLSFLNFFKTHPLSFSTPMDIMTNAKFPSFGPWDGGNISAFWTLNLYTNQRHLGLSFALSLFVIFLILRKKRGVLPGIILGLLLFTNQAAAGITILFLIWFFCAKPDMRKTLFAAGITTIPFIILLTRLTTLPSGIAWQPGYLTPEPLTIQSFLIFWFLNLGLHSLFIPIGFLLAPRRITKLFLVPLLILFILPNLFRFSPDMINNHKFFNFFMIIGAMFSAYAVTKFLDWKFSKINNDSSAERSEKIEFAVVGARTRSFMRERDRRTLDFGRATSALVIIFFLIFSGIIDLFPIFNDTKIRLVDLAGDPDIRFFSTIPAGSIVANSTWFYHPASLAGRPIFNGYSYFTWSYGYDQITRERETITLYQIQTREEACVLFKKHHISYLELSKNPESFLKPNTQLWQSLPAVYRNPSTGLSVYNVTTLCR